MHRHSPHRQDVEPSVDQQSSPNQLEPKILVDQVIGIKLHPLENEIVKDVEREEARVHVDSRVGLQAKILDVVVMKIRTRKRIQRQHRPTNHIQIHLQIDAIAEQPVLHRPTVPPSDKPVSLMPLFGPCRPTQKRPGRDHPAEESPANHRRDCRPVEPVTLEPKRGDSPQRQHQSKHQYPIEPITPRPTGHRIFHIPRNTPRRQHKLRHIERDEHRQWSEEPHNPLRPR